MTQSDVVFIDSMPEFYDRHLKALFFQPYADEGPEIGRAHV